MSSCEAPAQLRPASLSLFSRFWIQLGAFEVHVSPELQQQLESVVQELGVSIPPPVGVWLNRSPCPPPLCF